MVNCGCGFELFPDELHSKSNSQQNLSVQINTLLPQQHVWLLQVKWERLEATSDLLLPQLPPKQKIKNIGKTTSLIFCYCLATEFQSRRKVLIQHLGK